MTLNSTIFSVLHVNTRSVVAHNNTTKLDEIELLAAEYNFAVVCLTETWLDNSIENVTVQLNGYADLFRLDRNRHGGGVLAYVKNDIFCVRHFDYESDDVEMLWLELKTSNFRCLYIAMCYLPPNSYSRLKQKFTDSLSTVLASLLVDPDCCVLIIGDFSDHSVFKPIQLQLNLFRSLSAFGFHQFIDTATRDRMILDWA